MSIKHRITKVTISGPNDCTVTLDDGSELVGLTSFDISGNDSSATFTLCGFFGDPYRKEPA